MMLVRLLAVVLALALHATASAVKDHSIDGVPLDGATASDNVTAVQFTYPEAGTFDVILSDKNDSAYGMLWLDSRDNQDTSLPAIASIEALWRVPNITSFKQLSSTEDSYRNLTLAVGCTIWGDTKDMTDFCYYNYINAHTQVQMSLDAPFDGGDPTWVRANARWGPAEEYESTIDGNTGFVRVGDEVTLKIELLNRIQSIITLVNHSTGKTVILHKDVVDADVDGICAGPQSGSYAGCGVEHVYKNWGPDTMPGFEAITIHSLNITDRMGNIHGLDVDNSVFLTRMVQDSKVLANINPYGPSMLEITWPDSPEWLSGED